MLQRLDLRGWDTKDDLRGRLPRPHIAGDEPRSVVNEIIDSVKSGGDSVLKELTAKFDRVDLDQLRVSEKAIADSAEQVTPGLRSAMVAAIDGIERFHRHQLRPLETIEYAGLTIEAFQRPIKRAGLYVPGGRAEYPSTVLMTAVPARAAGVTDIALCVPPSAAELDTPGGIDRCGIPASVLTAAALAGVSEVFAVGGAQAIAALAYGTESIRPVDVIAGPGNVYVALAKQQVAGDVGIAAAFAGPSEVVVVADGTAVEEYSAIDLIVQAEHGPDGLAWLVTWDEEVADRICDAGDRLIASAARAEDVRTTLSEGGYVAIVDDPAAAIDVVDAIAPEHLELHCDNAHQMAHSVQNAGAIFLRSSSAGIPRRLCGWTKPRVAHLRLGEVCQCTNGRRLCKRSSHHHIITRGFVDPRSSRNIHGRSRRPRCSCRVRPSPPKSTGASMTRPSVRADLVDMVGYHSPQVDVTIRLNTNEAPFAPPPEFVAAMKEAVDGIDWHRYPDRSASRLRQALATCTASLPIKYSAPTDQTKYYRRCCLLSQERTGRPLHSNPPTRCTAT